MSLPIYFIDNIFQDNQKQVIAADVTLEDPYRTAFVMSGPGGDDGHGVSVDIEDGVTVTVDSGCCFNIIVTPVDAADE